MLKFLAKLPSFFASFFNAAKKAWYKLSPEIQKAMVHGSGVIAVINKYLTAAPEFVIDAIKQKFPDLHIEQLTTGLNKVAEALNIAESMNNAELAITVTNIQKYLATHKPDILVKSKTWALISHTAASAISIFLAPAETTVATITNLIEFGYQEFIKKDVEAMPLAA
jgi:hypothetical protein